MNKKSIKNCPCAELNNGFWVLLILMFAGTVEVSSKKENNLDIVHVIGQEP